MNEKTEPETIGDYTAAQFHSNNAIINKTWADMLKRKTSSQNAAGVFARLAGRLNAHLFHCHVAHINRGIANAINSALDDTIAKYNPQNPAATLDNIKHMREWMKTAVPESPAPGKEVSHDQN